MYCSNCGNKVAKTAKYCMKCGYPVNGNEENNPYVNQVNQDNSMNIQQNISMQQPVIEGQTEEDKKRRKWAVVIALVFGGGAMLAFVGFIALIAFVVYTSITDLANEEFIKVGDVEVLNFFPMAKGSKVCGVSTNTNFNGHPNTNIDVSICYYKELEDDVDNYFDYMIENYDFEEIYNGKDRAIIKRVNNSNYVIEIDFYLDTGSLVYSYRYDKNYESYIDNDDDDIIKIPEVD